MSDSEQSAATPEIRDVPEKSRYVLSLNGRGAGLVTYLDQGTHRVFLHTEVRSEYEGQGLAALLVRHALDDVRAQGRRAINLCPYIKVFLQKHHDWDALLDQPTPEVLAAVRAQQGDDS